VISLIARRLLQLPIILLVIYTLTLTLAWVVPGNPLDKPEGRRPPAEVQEAMRRQYNLDSFPRFYASYLSSALGIKWVSRELSGEAGRERREAEAAGLTPPSRPVFDLGPSLQYEDWRVNEIVGASLPVSVTLGFAAILIALFIGVGAGVVGAVKPNSLADLSTLAVALVGISLPNFVIGAGLVLLLPVTLGIGSIGGWGRVQDIVLPALTLSLPFAAYIARLTRMGMLEHLKADFIRTARAKGVPESGVMLRHALKNAFLPVLSYLGPACALAMTGSFVVEKVFTVPGMGQHFVNAVLNKDLFLIMGVVLIYATMLILFNLAVDVLYRWVDPRIEH
jgi:oligopeptide transport system permease protein